MRKLLKLALLIGGITLAAKLVAAKKAEWQGLTESEVRAKLEARLPTQVPEEKRAQIADQVVSKMRSRGFLTEEPVSDGGSKGEQEPATE